MLSALALFLLLSQAPASPAFTPSPGRFHLIRTESGSRGRQDGSRFLFEDSRTVFRAGQDRQVLVLFEWQGPAGRHRCEGSWKDPSGRVVFTSTSEVEARGPRFGAYWGLSLPDSVAVGSWALEAIVDGEPAGVHAFQFVPGETGVTNAPARRALPLAQLYQRALAATLTLEGLDANGIRTEVGSGLLLGPDLVLTTFTAINAARSVRVLTPTGPGPLLRDVVAWNRRENWALLRAGALGQPPAHAENARLGIGDRAYFLDVQPDGSRVIVETSVVGLSGGSAVLAAGSSEPALGSPILDEYGEVTATLGGTAFLLGASLLDLYSVSDATARVAPVPDGRRARPLPPLPGAPAATRTLEQLAAAGEFVKPVAQSSHFVQGVLGTGIERQHGIPVAVGQRFRFSRKDAHCVVFVTWIPSQAQEGTGAFVLFDEQNRRLAGTDPKPMKLRANQSFVQYWELDIANATPGIYRVDLEFAGAVVWRTFYRVID